VVPGERLKANARSIDGVLVLVIALFGVAVMDGVTALLIEHPSFVLTLAAVSFVANFGLQVLGAAAFAWARSRAAFTAGLLSGNRNLAVLIAVLPAGTDPTILFYFVIAQVPMYFAPAIVLPIYRCFARGRS
jgi:BASS family bile acid:Na+ symporter